KINYLRDKNQNNSFIVKSAMVILAIILICIFLPKQPRFQYEFERGKAWNHDNLVSPYNFAILKTQEELNKDREQILKTVQPIYNLNASVSKEQIDQFNTDIGEKWQIASMDSVSSQDMEVYEAVGNALLTYIYNRGVISLNNRYQNKGMNAEQVDKAQSEYNFTLIQDNVAQQKNTADIFTIESANQYIGQNLARNNKIDQKKWLAETLKNYVTINYIFDENLTNKMEQNALANISTTRGVVQKGELIAEKDKIINNETYQKLTSLRKV